MPGETQKLPSEAVSNDVSMEDVSNQVSISDDYFNAPSTSNSRIKFFVYNENKDSSHSFFLADNETVGKCHTML